MKYREVGQCLTLRRCSKKIACLLQICCEK